ncbi:MAG: hypothetical protein CM15mP8_4730 [Methanobacteriota archaeon]|nr:MAG: hypothetical protein CM15mP8_4730 [Euryarchaeota archaeon]
MSLGDSFRQSLFQAISIGTSTGYYTDYMTWPVFDPVFFDDTKTLGACAAQQAGGSSS